MILCLRRYAFAFISLSLDIAGALTLIVKYYIAIKLKAILELKFIQMFGVSLVFNILN